LASWIAPVYIELRRRSSALERYRVVTATLVDGVPVAELPGNDPRSFSDLLQGWIKDRVIAFRLVGPGLALYRSRITVEWLD
jgi:hypothetical protein